MHIENLSLKKADKSAGFNQIDKRPVFTYQRIWKFDDDTAKWLRLFTGDLLPTEVLSENELSKIKDERRLFFTEIPNEKLQKIIRFFQDNKMLVVSDILRGRGGLSADWFLVTRKSKDNSVDWAIKDINTVCNFMLKEK